MHQKTTVIPYDDFLTRFLPTRRRARTSNRVPKRSNHSSTFFATFRYPVADQMYGTLSKMLNRSGLCPGHKVVSSVTKRDTADPAKPSVVLGMYPKKCAPQPPSDGSTAGMDWASVDIPIECKYHPTEEDPFDDDASDAMPITTKRKVAQDRLLFYADLIYRYQQRKHVFILAFLGDFVRIIRIDHSGLFTTQKLNYKEDDEKLSDFLWRFSRMTPDERGHDTTAIRIKPTSVLGQGMRNLAQSSGHGVDHVRDAFKKSLDPSWPWWRLEVPIIEHEGTPEETRRVKKFFVGKPHFLAPGVSGRATRGYIALPLTTKDQVDGPFVYLKDTWRLDWPGAEREGSILRELNDLKIEYVPTLVCHGDIPGQTTISQDIWSHYHPDEQEHPLKRHQHYRIVVQEVGQPLDKFEHGHQLVYALLCCIHAHQAAYNAGILHGDISYGNILLCYDPEGGWQGMLNDWEFSKRVFAGQAPSGGHQLYRTGTWKFMSVHTLENRFWPIVVADELEAFFNVLLYCAIRFLPSNCPDSAVGSVLHHYFDDGFEHSTCGQMKYFTMKTGDIDLTLFTGGRNAVGSLRFYKPGSNTEHPIQMILDTMLRWLAAYYALDRAAVRIPRSSPCDFSMETIENDGTIVVPPGFLEVLDLCDPPHGPASSSAHIGITAASTEARESSRTLGSTPTAAAPDAQKIQTHDAILRLLVDELEQVKKWPVNDKRVDKQPKETYLRPTYPHSVASESRSTPGSTRIGGTKRRRVDGTDSGHLSTAKKRYKV